MLTERIMLEEAKDRWLIGSQALLCKYMLCQEWKTIRHFLIQWGK